MSTLNSFGGTSTGSSTGSNLRQIAIKSPKKGKLNDATFGPFLTLATSEPFSGKHITTFREEERNISPPFRRPGVSPLSSGKGSDYGCFNPKTYEIVGEPPKKDRLKEQEKDVGRMKNFYTSPGKKGKNIGNMIIPYYPDPYGGDVDKVNLLYGRGSSNGYDDGDTYSSYGGGPRSGSPHAMGPPFRSMDRGGKVFDPYVFSPYDPPGAKRKAEQSFQKRSEEFHDRTYGIDPSFNPIPFKPSSPNKSGFYGTFQPHPGYDVGADPSTSTSMAVQLNPSLATRAASPPVIHAQSAAEINARQYTGNTDLQRYVKK